MSEGGIIKSRTLNTTPSPRATALLCMEILETRRHGHQRWKGSVRERNQRKWAREQLLKMIIEDWPEVEQ